MPTNSLRGIFNTNVNKQQKTVIYHYKPSGAMRGWDKSIVPLPEHIVGRLLKISLLGDKVVNVLPSSF